MIQGSFEDTLAEAIEAVRRLDATLRAIEFPEEMRLPGFLLGELIELSKGNLEAAFELWERQVVQCQVIDAEQGSPACPT
jgi:hypothetical protein